MSHRSVRIHDIWPRGLPQQLLAPRDSAAAGDGRIARCPLLDRASCRDNAVSSPRACGIPAALQVCPPSAWLLRGDSVFGNAHYFTNTCGRPLGPDGLSVNFAKLLATSGLRPVRLHDLRHGAASLALQAGADLKVAQDQLGHSSIVLTADTYVTVLPEVARTNAENVARLVLNAARCAPGSRRSRRPNTRPTSRVKPAGPRHQHPNRR